MYTEPNELTEKARFSNWDEYREAEHSLHQLVQQGRLYACGLDPLEPTAYVQVFKTPDGEARRLAAPDHAFCGYLKRTPPEDERAASGLIIIQID